MFTFVIWFVWCVYDVYMICYRQSEGLWTDYCSPWVRELTWALFPGEELFAAAAAAAAAAETLRSDDLDDVYMILIWRVCDIICFYIISHDAYQYMILYVLPRTRVRDSDCVLRCVCEGYVVGFVFSSYCSQMDLSPMVVYAIT